MENFLDDWGLTVAAFLPLVGVAVLLLIPRAMEEYHKAVALATSLLVLEADKGVASYFDYDNAGTLQNVVDKGWITFINSRYIVGVDGISLPLVLLTMLIVALCILYCYAHFPEPHNPKAFLILFFVFFELVLLPMYFMIGVWGGENRMYAAIKFFLFTLFGSALMIVSFLALYFLSDKISVDGQLLHTFDMRALPDAASGIAKSTQIWIFAGMFLGFGIKVPIFPFHTWLPDAHTEAPTVGSVILAAVLLKLGTYGFVRVAIPILPRAAHEWAPYIGALAVIG